MTRTSSLQLGKISMRNYKAYRGNVAVVMSLEHDRTITVIHGEMGKGKTTLLGAIYWCLYGKDRSTTDSDEGILNNDALSQLKVGDGDETSVELVLYEQGKLRYKIKRTVRFDKKQESFESKKHPLVGGRLPTGIEVAERIDYSESPRSEGGDWSVLHDPLQIRDRIENLFPQSLSSYFLFDAELLDTFFSTDDETLVKNGIEKISGMPIIDNAIKHLCQSRDAIRKDIKKVDLEPIKNKIFHSQKEIKSHSKTITETNVQLKRVITKITGIEYFLRNHNEESIESIQSEVETITENMKEINKQKAENQQKINEWILLHTKILQLKNVLADSMKQCDAWEKEGKIPIAVSRHALNGMLHGNPPTCICGAPLDKGSAGRLHIEGLLEKNLAESPVIQSISIGRGHWGDLVDKIKQARDVFADLRAERNRLRSKYDGQDSRRKELSKILEVHDIEEVRRKSQDLRELREKKSDLDGIKAIAVHGQERAERVLSSLDDEYNNSLERDNKYASQVNRMELAKTLSRLLANCRVDLIEDMRHIVAKKTEEYFFKLVSRDDFVKIEIYRDYQTVVVGRDEKRKSLSAGQSCCLALSYIAAIRDIAEKNYFMIIDSPLHNISQAERVDIARNLPKFIPGTQITLLVQDQEYTGSAKKGITGGDIQSVRKTLIDNKSLWREYLLITSKSPNDVSASTTIQMV